MATCRFARGRRRRGAQPRQQVKASGLSSRDWAEVFAVIAVLIVLVSGINKLRQPGVLPIQRVHFEHAAHAVTGLRKAVAPHVTGNFFTVDLRAIERALTRLSWIESASVRREWPDTLRIRVSEYEAVARWGADALLSRDGQVFRPHEREMPDLLPVLHGPAGRARHLLGRYRQLSKTLAPANLTVGALVEDQRRAWHLLLDIGVPVEIGRGDPRARVARFARVYPEVLAPRTEQIKSIDLRYTNGFAVVWKRPDGAGGAQPDAMTE
ncbi:MAG: cell division protein FtsQ/DivIB [Gammaproteobacteria bacterium]